MGDFPFKGTRLKSGYGSSAGTTWLNWQTLLHFSGCTLSSKNTLIELVGVAQVYSSVLIILIICWSIIDYKSVRKLTNQAYPESQEEWNSWCNQPFLVTSVYYRTLNVLFFSMYLLSALPWSRREVITSPLKLSF